MKLTTGNLFDNRYLLQQQLGVGGFSEVWKVQDTDVGNLVVALKVFAPGNGLDSQGLEIFSKEYSLVFNLNHPNLLRPSYFGKCDGSPYLVMPYCKSGSALNKIGEMSENELAVFMQQAASALAYLHRQEPPIIHQDIKPDNFLIGNEDNYLLADFGISSQIRRTLTKSMGDKVSSGTMAYMPPEKWGKKKITLPAGDIFALGATMYELLSGELPFGNMGGLAVHNGADIPDLPDGFSAGINDMVSACMAPNPNDRPTAGQLESIAANYLKTGQWQAMPSAENEAAHKPEPIPFRKGQETQEMPIDKIPQPPIPEDNDNTVSATDDGKPSIPSQRRKRPWLIWLIILAVLAVLGIVIGIIVANSGPSAEEIAAKEKLKADSIDAVAATVDSLKAVATADSIAAAINNTGKVGSETQTSSTTSGTGFVFDYPTVYVAGDTFTMGCTSEQGSDCYDDEKPSHSVTVGSFNIGKYEVTQAQWKSVMGSNPSSFKGCDNCPVESVSWNDVQEFIKKLNSLTGKKYRLPKEAEWEFAARGGNKSRGYQYSGSDNLGSVAWYSDNSGSKTHPVGQKSPNELGIYDMSGNVLEWCADWFKGYPGSSGVSDQTNSFRVLRGGGWDDGARYCRVSYRGSYGPGFRSYDDDGFRLVLSP